MELCSRMTQCALKVLDQTLTPLHPSIGTLNAPARCNRNKSCFALGCFFGFRGLRSKLEANLGHDLRIERLQCLPERVRMIAVVKQNCDLRNIDWLGTKVVQVVAEHLNQTLVVSDVCFCTGREKWQSQRIDR